MTTQVNTIIVGAGQAGLAMGYYLSKQDRDTIILEKASTLVPAWRSRWDSFTLVLPNWTLQMPDYHYSGDDPNGFMTRDDIVAYMEGFAKTFDADIRFNTEVIAVESNPDGSGYIVRTTGEDYLSENVVIAAGTYQSARIPAFASNFADDIFQIHTSQYTNPEQLPDGAVLVVGTGQSGCQIAEELYMNGRKVYLCVGGAQRIDRRYRGKDMVDWLGMVKFFDQPAHALKSSKERFTANVFLTGKDGGRALDLHQFAKDGVQLLGRLTEVQGTALTLAPDLHEKLKKVDDFVLQARGMIDKAIAENALEADDPTDDPLLTDGYDTPIIESLDLKEAGITSVVWATGYKFDFSWVKFPILDDDGYPQQMRGVTPQPGLYFVGLHFLFKRRSGLPWGVGEDAEHIANYMAEQS